MGDTSVFTNSDREKIILNHEFALFPTKHGHEYKHSCTDWRCDGVIGSGGAPLIAGGAFHAYAVIDRQAIGLLKVAVCDVTSNSVVDSWIFGPKP